MTKRIEPKQDISEERIQELCKACESKPTPFGYVARDVDGELWWYKNKPEEYDGAYIEANYHDDLIELDRGLFPEIAPGECRPFFGSI